MATMSRAAFLFFLTFASFVSTAKADTVYDLIAGDFTDNSSWGLNGFSGANVGNITFSDAALGNVPQFNSVVLDFGFTTGNSGGGIASDGVAPGNSLTFTVSGSPFTGMGEEEICNAVFGRFQRVDANGEGSDVGTLTAVPEPATMLLLGTGLLWVAGVARKIMRARRESK